VKCLFPPVVDPGSFVTWDTETHLIEPGNLTPKLVCVQMQPWINRQEGPSYVFGATEEGKRQGIGLILDILENKPEISIIAQNGFYDWGVLLNYLGWDMKYVRLVFAAFRRGQIRDTTVRGKLVALENDWLDYDPTINKKAPVFSLEELVQKWCGCKVEGKHGPDVWRLRYAELDGKPANEWPAAAFEYAMMDPVWVGRVWNAMVANSQPSPDEIFQTRSAWCLHLAGVWGIKVDEIATDNLENKVIPAIEAGIQNLVKLGVYYQPVKWDNDRWYADMLKVWPNMPRTASGKPSTSKDTMLELMRRSGGNRVFTPGLKIETRMDLFPDYVLEDGPPKKDTTKLKEMVKAGYKAKGLAVPETKKGDISTARKTLKQVPALEPLVNIGSLQKIKTTYLPIFKKHWIFNPRWNFLVATGRVSVNYINNMPRVEGVRECFKARDGYLLVSVDYAQAELCSLAQVNIDLFGHSEMARLIKEGIDLHLHLVSKMKNKPYEWLVANKKNPEVKDWRQAAKAANFGFPGGLGIEKFMVYAADSYGVDLDEDEAQELKDSWFETYPEMRQYFRWINNKLRGGESFTAVQHRTGRKRGRVGYTDGANTFFQGLTADGAKNAMIQLTEEMWLDADSPLYECRLVAFIYDEMLVEIKDRGPVANTVACKRICDVMSSAMQEFTPDVPAKCEPALMRNWCKAAEMVWGEVDGQKVLLPWEERPQASKEKMVA